MSILNDGLIYLLVNKYHVVSTEWQYFALLLTFVILSIAASYFLGSINSAIIVSRLVYGEDVRTKGSGNAGLTNMHRNYGNKGALLTLLGDASKTAIAILFTALLLGFGYNHGISLNDGYCYMSGLFVALGHVFPIYYGFKGGKGVLVTAITAMILTPLPSLFLFVLFVAVVAASKYVSLGSVTVAVLYPVVVSGYVSFVFGGAKLPGILALCCILFSILIVWCHRKNLQRISDRTENKISFKKKKDD
ncbi:MAG: glycerol-3-phosphate acyltransferase [Ruminococcaceae bacterium]|nr:glycerol-3-phosphate acyltransferase [Oscillospiraceae bacterium]